MENDDLVPDNPPVLDGFLWHLVHQANTNGLTLAVVLNIGGAVVTGQLTSEKNYFESTANRMVENWVGLDDETREGIREATAGFGKASENRDDVDAHYFVHLQGAVVHIGNFTFVAPLWRGRLSSVQGYILGSATNP